MSSTDTTLNPVKETPSRAMTHPPLPLNYDEDDDVSPEMRAALFGQYEASLSSKSIMVVYLSFQTGLRLASTA